jgi:hypothetical protein
MTIKDFYGVQHRRSERNPSIPQAYAIFFRFKNYVIEPDTVNRCQLAVWEHDETIDWGNKNVAMVSFRAGVEIAKYYIFDNAGIGTGTGPVRVSIETAIIIEIDIDQPPPAATD